MGNADCGNLIEGQDVSAGINIYTKRYKKLKNKYAREELLVEVEGPWTSGFE